MATLRVTNLRGRTANVAPDLPDGANITGVCTATSFAGDGSSLTGIDATQIVTGNTSVQTVDTGSDGHVKVNTEGSERLRVDPSGRVLVGYTANVGGSKLQSNTTGSAAIEGISWYNGADHTGFSLRKSRGGLGDYTIVQDGDGLGLINFAGSDGNGWANGARIQATVNGTPGDGDMPTKLEFQVSDDGTTNLTERLEINSSGITVTGTVAATSYTGDGSALTGIEAGVTTTSQYNQSGVITINLSTGQGHEVTLAAGISTITVTGGTAGVSHHLIITQPSSGITTVGFSTYFLWPSGSPPDLSRSSASSEIDMISFVVKQQTQTGTGVTQLLASAGIDYQ
jgi:hypothetical protein